MTITNGSPFDFNAPSQATAGSRLRAARESRSLSIADAAKQTRLTREMLTALEEMETSHISATIVRMQAATYAGFLGLPSQDIANAYAPSRAVTEAESLPASKMQKSDPFSQRLVWPAAIAAAVLVVGTFGLMSLGNAGQTTEELPVYRQVAGGGTNGFDAAQTVGLAKRELSVRANKSSWIEVRGSDGTIFRNRIMTKGETYYPRMQAGWTITVRNAGAFEWWLGEQRIGALGEHGQSVYALSVDEAQRLGEEMIQTELAAQGEDQQPAR